MPLQSYWHNPIRVEAIQVAKPWKGVSDAYPWAKQIKNAAGGCEYFVVSEPGRNSFDPPRAYPGDWIVKTPRGVVIMTDEEFAEYFSAPDAWEEKYRIPEMDTEPEVEE